MNKSLGLKIDSNLNIRNQNNKMIVPKELLKWEQVGDTKIVIRRRTDDTKVKRKREQTTIHKTIHRKLMMEQQEPH